MAQFLISYDLHKRRDYPPLWNTLLQWDAVKILESVWLANLVGPAPAIRDILLHHVDNDDSIAVIELKPGSDWAIIRCPSKGSAWLSNNIAIAG